MGEAPPSYETIASTGAVPAAEAPQTVGCPGCGAHIGVPPGTPPGAQIQCPTCKAIIGVPGGMAPATQPMVQQMAPQPMQNQPIQSIQQVQPIQPTQSVIACPTCQAQVGVPPGTAPGAQLACPGCQGIMAVPGGALGGAAASPVVVVNHQGIHHNPNDAADVSNAQMLFIVGFCCSICWLYVAIKYWSHRNPVCRKYARRSLCVLLLIFALQMVVIIYVTTSGVSHYGTYYGYYNRRYGRYYGR